MPFIHIKSLPLTENFGERKTLLPVIARAFADATGIDGRHITVTWEFLPQDGFWYCGSMAASDGAAFPVVVDMLVPDFNSDEKVNTMLDAVANALNFHAQIDKAGLFINLRLAHSGKVYDGGSVVRW